MAGLIVALAVLVVLGATHLVAYRAGQSQGSRAAAAALTATRRQMHDLLRAARRAVAADPSLPNDSALRRQELALALDEYDSARTELP